MEESKEPLVSIIVVTYNSSKYVLETLESVRKQTYQNIELIITDDYSLDNTVAICNEWVKENNKRFVRTKIITTQNNTGIPSNCNRGVKNSAGKWIKLIAADDHLLEKCIQDNLLFIKENPQAKFVVSNLLEMNDKGVLIENESIENRGLKFYFSANTATSQLKAYTRWPVFLNSPTFFINKELFERIDYFDECYRIYDDMTLIYRVNSNNYKIYYLNKTTVVYRIHKSSISRDSRIDNDRVKESLEIFEKYRRKNLTKFNLIDLSIYYEHWLNNKWKGIKGHKGLRILIKFSLFHWYAKYCNLKFTK
ncbi:MAG: glycosyltransferase [Dysgonamonadaceae bacterium]|jgi:alpha-1,3-rhamnosyltransferase|nr:glycosyltransferase [Dysgonamonadaceae bacterium]